MKEQPDTAYAFDLRSKPLEQRFARLVHKRFALLRRLFNEATSYPNKPQPNILEIGAIRELLFWEREFSLSEPVRADTGHAATDVGDLLDDRSSSRRSIQESTRFSLSELGFTLPTSVQGMTDKEKIDEKSSRIMKIGALMEGLTHLPHTLMPFKESLTTTIATIRRLREEEATQVAELHRRFGLEPGRGSL